MNNLKTARQDWKIAEVEKMYEMPFMDLLFTAQSIHRANFLPNQIQVSTLLSRKTGARPFNILCQ